jgi:hypothetical protein
MKFAPNLPVETTKPTVVVDSGLPTGQHRFQLVVVNAAGRQSQPAEVIVTIESTRPVFPGPITPLGPIDIVGPSRPVPP